jgi:hypothetical protein
LKASQVTVRNFNTLTPSQKIKCDETRPKCLRCTTRGQQCPGYKQSFGWSNKHGVFAVQTWNASIAPDETVPQQQSSHQATLPSTSRALQTDCHVSIIQYQSSPQRDASPAIAWRQSDPSPIQPITVPASATGNSSGHLEPLRSDVFNGDLREWLASHEPVTLLLQQDWAWTPAANAQDNGERQLPLESDTEGVPSSNVDMRQALIDYFFDNLCCIYNVIDNTANRFKSLVNRYLVLSPLLCKSIVCLAVVHCFQAQEEQGMLPICLEYHSEAVTSLSTAVAHLETVISQSTDFPRNSNLA